MNDATPWIDTDAQLRAFTDQVADSPWLAADTEFLREHTYYPQLCLIQVSDGTHHALIDVQADLDCTPLLELLKTSSSVNVFHACLQDAEALQYRYGMLLEHVFDTQIAWAMIGHGYQRSYAHLVLEMLDIDLDKSETRSRWDRRPLTENQKQYALSDVVHLGSIYQMLHTELETRGRLPWMREEMQRMLAPETWAQDPFAVWQMVMRKVKQFPRERTGALRELAAWREEAARRRDIPRRRLLSDDVLASLAINPPATIEECRTMIGSGPASKRLCGEMQDALARAENAPPVSMPDISRRERERRQERIRDLRPQLDAVSEEYSVSRELLATRGMVLDLVAGERDCLLRQGWRGELLRKALPNVPELHA